MKIGRKIYYDLETGNVILDTGEIQGSVIPTSIEQDFETYRSLKERVKDTVGVIQLEFGQYSQDFKECNGYRVNLDTLELEFTYPVEEQPQEPVYQKPLTQQVNELEERTTATEEVLLTLLMTI